MTDTTIFVTDEVQIFEDRDGSRRKTSQPLVTIVELGAAPDPEVNVSLNDPPKLS
jgi:hypothetical protein